MSPKQHLRIGVFVPESVQLLDMSPIDLFGMLDPKYLTACQLPAPLISLGVPSTIHYISTPAVTKSGYVELTANAILKVSHSINDEEVQPGSLDILLIPGPDPATLFDDDVLEFLRGHVGWKGNGEEMTDVLSVCTGCIALGQGGILNGRNASGPRGIMPKLKNDFPRVKWIDDKRWLRDGNIWTSGGITNGQEMVAAYLREKYSGPATEAVLAMADVGDKGIEYRNGQAKETAWWLWQILKASIRTYVWK